MINRKLKIAIVLVVAIFSTFTMSIYAAEQQLNIYEEEKNIVEKVDYPLEGTIEFSKENLLKELNKVKVNENTTIKVPMQNSPRMMARTMQMQEKEIGITYQSHIQDIGWQNEVTSENASGLAGKGKKLEAIKVNLNNFPEGVKLKYKAHVQNIGWQDYVSNGEIAGTEGESLSLEAFQMYLEGTTDYSVEYRAYIQGKGWQDWARDNAISGTTGKSLRLEALQIRIVEKTPTVKYTAHAQNIGWQNYVSYPSMAGTEGRSLRLESLKIEGMDLPEGASIEYRTHVQDIGWQGWVKNGELSGTTGRAKRLEALQIVLKNAPEYSIEYRTHVQDIGWQGWVKNGEVSGTTGRAKRLEAVEIKIVRNPVKFNINIESPEFANITKETFDISGYVLANKENTKYKIYVDDKEVTTVSKEPKPELFDKIKDYGTEKQNPAPYFSAKLNTDAFKPGKHTIKVVATSRFGESRVEFTKQIRIVDTNISYGIDVSKFQGDIDWKVVKDVGIDFAMIRVGFRGYFNPMLVEDIKFEKNITGALANDIKVGLYFFTQATTEQEAVEEANFAIERAKKYNVTYPIAIDTEWSNPDKDGRADHISNAVRTATCDAFCKTVQNAGYKPMIYGSKNWFIDMLDMNVLNKYNIWLAHYTENPDTLSSYKGPYTMWQYTSSGTVNGILGRVDMNIEYK